MKRITELLSGNGRGQTTVDDVLASYRNRDSHELRAHKGLFNEIIIARFVMQLKNDNVHIPGTDNQTFNRLKNLIRSHHPEPELLPADEDTVEQPENKDTHNRNHHQPST